VNPAAPFIRLATPGARLRARSGRVKIGLRGCRGCRGRLALTARVKGKRVRIGRASFTVATSGKVTVTVKLSARGKALLRRVKRIPLAAALSVTATDGRTARGSGRLTIRK
jgi:hypothetical protein